MTTPPLPPLVTAARDWPVLPIWPRGKEPIPDLAPNGFYNATTDPDTIAEWWTEHPKANHAIRTGAASKTVVIDEDTEHGGGDTIHDLQHELGPLPETPNLLTGRGQHRYFLYPDDGIPVPCSTGKLGPGIDIRADGGYAIAAGSVHQNGATYQWELGSSPEDLPLAPLPAAWLAAIRATASTEEREPVDMAGVLEGVPEGQRNWEIFRMICKLRRVDVPYVWAHRLGSEAAANCTPPFPEREVTAIVNNVYRRYQPEPTVDMSEFDEMPACPDCAPLRERVAVLETEAAEQRSWARHIERRRARHFEAVRYKRAVRRIVRDPGLDDGQKMAVLLFGDISEQWQRKPSPGGKTRLLMAKTAEAYTMPKSTLRARRDAMEKMGALAVEEQTVYHPVVDDRTGQPKLDPTTGRIKTWPETIITVTPKAYGTELIEGIASRKFAPDVPRVKAKKKPRGLWCSNKCVADVIRKTVTTWECGGCGEVIKEKRTTTASETPPTNFAPLPPQAENVPSIYGSKGTNSAPLAAAPAGYPRQTLPPLGDGDDPFDRPVPPAVVATARSGTRSPLEQQPGQPTFRVVSA